MARASKYAKVMAVIQRRILEGDYLLRTIPGERRLAAETGVSYMTARRAVTELIKQRVLIRHPNGSLDAHPDYIEQSSRAKVVLLYPSYPSPYLARLRWIVASALDKRDQTLRPVQYVHWDDPIVLEALANEGGAVVIPSADSIPSWVLSVIKANRVVVLDGDFSQDGIPSIQLFPDRHFDKVFSHLGQLGHRRIDCVNTQHHNPEIDRRIAFWRKWLGKHKGTGKLWDNPAPSFSDPTPYAFEMMSRLIDEQKIDATAIVCTTFPAAVATIRAFWERGRQLGRDVSVCAVNIEDHARYHCPSVAGLDMPDLSDVLFKCFDWFTSGKAWRGSFLLQPHEIAFFAGESCGPAGSRDTLRGPAR